MTKNGDSGGKMARSRAERALLVAAGTLCLGLGIIGMAVPVLPTTPFLLLAAACFARSSTRFYNWLMGNRLFGRYILDYREGRGVPFGVKVTTASFLWATIAVSAVLIDSTWVTLVLVIIGLSVSVHIFTLKTGSKG